MESIYGRADVLDRAAGGGWAILKEEKATIEAAAVRLTHDVQVWVTFPRVSFPRYCWPKLRQGSC